MSRDNLARTTATACRESQPQQQPLTFEKRQQWTPQPSPHPSCWNHGEMKRQAEVQQPINLAAARTAQRVFRSRPTPEPRNLVSIRPRHEAHGTSDTFTDRPDRTRLQPTRKGPAEGSDRSVLRDQPCGRCVSPAWQVERKKATLKKSVLDRLRQSPPRQAKDGPPSVARPRSRAHPSHDGNSGTSPRASFQPTPWDASPGSRGR